MLLDLLLDNSEIDQDPIVSLDEANIVNDLPSLQEQALYLSLRSHPKLLAQLRLDCLETIDALVDE